MEGGQNSLQKGCEGEEDSVPSILSHENVQYQTIAREGAAEVVSVHIYASIDEGLKPEIVISNA